jgi:hypothetical protein
MYVKNVVGNPLRYLSRKNYVGTLTARETIQSPPIWYVKNVANYQLPCRLLKPALEKKLNIGESYIFKVENRVWDISTHSLFGQGVAMKESNKLAIIENAKILAKHKKEFNPFDPMTQNSEYILWQRTYHKSIKYTPKQWERIVRHAKWIYGN